MEKKLIALYGPAGSGKDYFCKVLDYFYNTIMHNWSNNDRQDPDFIHIMDMFNNNKPKSDKERVIRMAFADPLKESMSIIFQIPLHHLHDTQFKEAEYINMKTLQRINTSNFSSIELEEFFTQNLILSDIEYFNFISKKEEVSPLAQELINKDRVYMNLRNLLTYYGTYVCRGFINDTIWINNILKCPKFVDWEKNATIKLLIVTDVRFEEEFNALKEKGATVIKIVNPDNKKKIGGVAESHYNKFVPDYIFRNDMDQVEFLRNFKILFKALFPEFFKS